MQHFNYGRGVWLYLPRDGAEIVGGVPFEGLRFHLGLTAAPFHTGLGGKRCFLSALVFLSQFAVATGYAYERAGLFEFPWWRNPKDY